MRQHTTQFNTRTLPQCSPWPWKMPRGRPRGTPRPPTPAGLRCRRAGALRARNWYGCKMNRKFIIKAGGRGSLNRRRGALRSVGRGRPMRLLPPCFFDRVCWQSHAVLRLANGYHTGGEGANTPPGLHQRCQPPTEHRGVPMRQNRTPETVRLQTRRMADGYVVEALEYRVYARSRTRLP